MLTGQMSNAEVVVMNEDALQALSDTQKQAIEAASLEIRERATKAIQGQRGESTEELRKLGMTVIGPEDGRPEAFRRSAAKPVDERLGEKYGSRYKKIRLAAACSKAPPSRAGCWRCCYSQ